MTTQPSGTSGDVTLKVRRGRVDSVDLYEIKDTELDLLERGSPADLQLNFAIFLLSTALTALGTLFTTAFRSSVTRTVYIVIGVVGLLGGAYLLIAWGRNRSTLKQTCARIRGRIPPDGVSPLVPESPPPSSNEPTLPSG